MENGTCLDAEDSTRAGIALRPSPSTDSANEGISASNKEAPYAEDPASAAHAALLQRSFRSFGNGSIS